VPSYVNKITWHLAGANGIEGRGPPLIGSIQGTIVRHQYDLEKAHIDNGTIRLVRSWFVKNTGKADDKNVNTNELKTLHSDVLQLYKVRKQLRITDYKVAKKKAKLV